jgi:hypothetical protein
MTDYQVAHSSRHDGKFKLRQHPASFRLRDVNVAGDVDGVGIVSHDRLDRFVHLDLMCTVTVVR